MIDKITSRIKRYPFQTGIIIGCIVCLLLVGFVSLFQDNGKTLSGNNDIIREDYLRMAIMEYSQNRDEQLAGWRYQHLGAKADETLQLMRGDDSISPQLLAAFANAVGKTNILRATVNSDGTVEGTPASPKKGLSGFGKTVLIILGLLVLCAAGFYAASVIQTKQKQKRRTEANQRLRDEPMNVVTPEKARSTGNADAPDTLFDLDSLFPQNDEKKDNASKEKPASASPAAILKDIPNLDGELDKIFNEENEDDSIPSSVADTVSEQDEEIIPETDDSAENDVNEPAEISQEPESEDIPEASEIEEDYFAEDDAQDDTVEETMADSELEDAADLEDEDLNASDEEDTAEMIKNSLDYETTIFALKDEETVENDSVPAPASENPVIESPAPGKTDDAVTEAERPLVETDPESDTENEDELLKMIRSAKTTSDELAAKYDGPESVDNIDGIEAAETIVPEFASESEETDDEVQSDILIHYQSTYRIGNDMYDEVFSIDQGDVFRGECGISIGETLNNTEPKAVTAFEIWLFDKDDIHTATWYLMSDFAMNNDGIRERLQQHGTIEKIRKNTAYVLETETLQVEVRVLDMEYGTEMEEKNSYFTNVSFDVIAREKDTAINMGES